MAKPRSKMVPGRSRAEWLRRGFLALTAAIFGYFAITNSLAKVIERADAERAHVIAPRDGVVTAAAAEQKFALSAEAGSSSTAARLARLALRQDATATNALNVLGLQAQMRNETEKTREIFRYSLDLSRRELQPQLWTIEEAVSRGDIKGALRGYDVALRTSSRAKPILFPVLSTAIAEPRVRSELLPIIASKPNWSGDFLAYLVNSSSKPLAALTFIRAAEKRGLAVNDDDRALLVNALASTDGYEQAWDYYATFHPQADRSRSRDPQFTLGAGQKTLFDWRATEDPQLSAVILTGRQGGALDFSVPPTIGGVLMSQTQLLPPGIYRFEGRSRGIDQPRQSLPYWLLRCRSGRELGRLAVPNSEQNNGEFEGEFRVPADCPEQTLVFVARASESVSGLSGQIRYAALAPATRSKTER
ncbi:hypothetical protein LCM19_10140 [Qipengyuania flava]|nr:hypothetical protein [Qipengyuania flava]